jgi:hypothetical protein
LLIKCAPLQDEVINILKECASKTNTDEKEILYPDFLKSTPSQSLLCMLKCFVETMEIVNSDGAIIEEMVANNTAQFTSEFREKLISCGNEIEKISTCDDIEKYRICILPAVI